MSFTGSTEVGRHVGELALQSATIKRTMLELGGNGPLIVTEDVDLERAVHTALVGKFLHQGQMCIAINRIFGPVATILRAHGDGGAVQIANATSYGLTSGVLCRNVGRAMKIAHQIEAGMTHVNDIPAVDMPQMPFGGEKNSGLGRFGSAAVIETLTTQHWISIQHSEQPFPF